MVVGIDGSPALRRYATGTEIYARSIIDALAASRGTRTVRVYANAVDGYGDATLASFLPYYYQAGTQLGGAAFGPAVSPRPAISPSRCTTRASINPAKFAAATSKARIWSIV